MKRACFIIPCFLLLACSAQKSVTTATLASDCPKNGTCTTELIKNRTIVLKTDEFGQSYYTLEDSANVNVIKFTYDKTVKGDIQDAGYREEIVFEWNPRTKSLSDVGLQKTKMLFGRFCFCRGQTGYYKITKGRLTVANKSKKRLLTLQFKTDEVPQITQKISISLE